MDHSELRRMGKMRHEKSVAHGDVHKHLEHEMSKHKKPMAHGGSSSVFGSNPVKNGPTDQLRHSMENFTPTKLKHGGSSHKGHK